MFLAKWIINLGLACVTIYVGFKIYDVWSAPPSPEVILGQVSAKKTVSPALPKPSKREKIKPASYYQVIVEKDLFSPDRKPPKQDPEAQKGDKSVEKKRLPANLQLFGVVLKGRSTKALLSNPDRRKNKKRYVWVTEGEEIGGYKLIRIHSDRVVLDKRGVRYELSLYAGKKRRTQPLRPKAQVRKTKKVPESVKKRAKTTKTRSSILPSAGRKRASKDREKVISTPFGNIKRK